MTRTRIKLPNGRQIKRPSPPISPPRGPVAVSSSRPPVPMVPPVPATSPAQPSLPETLYSDDVKDWQLEQEVKDQLLASLPQIQKLMGRCRATQAELAAAGEPWLRQNTALSLVAPTEFERAQHQMIDLCDTGLRQLDRVRRKNISPTAIRITRLLGQIRGCCRKCRRFNLQQRAAGRPFACLVNTMLNPARQPGFRYRLNEKGEILESPG